MTSREDPRSYRVAVVADSLLEPMLAELERDGWGVIQLPPAGLDRETAEAWLEQVAEHVAEFCRNGYEVVLADDGAYTDGLVEALEKLRVPELPRYQ